jgi:hypothetical protein
METDTKKIVVTLNKALRNMYFTKFTYGITYFDFELINEPLDIYASVSIGDFELQDKAEWNRWVQSYPFNLPNFCGPEEPARVFLLALLTQASIQDIEEENGGTLIIHFQNEHRVRVLGEVEIVDISWNIKFTSGDGTEIGNCCCSFNELFFTIGEGLQSRLAQIH